MAQNTPDPVFGNCDNKPNDAECIKKRKTMRFIIIVLLIIVAIGFINFLTGNKLFFKLK
jgi:hypothetical protein